MKGTDRGQTTIDFAIGVSLFLLVVVFVFLFVPELLEPFNSGSQEETVAVNRVADELSQRQLGTAKDPYVLNATCAVQFFRGLSPGNCNYQDGTFREQLDLDPRTDVNVTFTRVEGTNITDTSDVLCWDASEDELIQSNTCSPSASPSDVVLQRGDNVPLGSSSSVSARRVVTMDGQAISITVVMW